MAKRGKPAFSPETDALIAVRKADGEQPIDLATEYGCSIPTIYAAIKRHIRKVAGGALTPTGRTSSTPGDTRKSPNKTSVALDGSGSATPAA